MQGSHWITQRALYWDDALHEPRTFLESKGFRAEQFHSVF